ncbi:lipopolysaccharide transport periplasmic protein LptA [Sulfurovum sp.]|uniref:lipopolysaccharide transport periplasmic protein LptA n=1 Tax=Sulfurovum sp. TaxID=1969726 RepID=UPI00286824E1|nr:lipopolysaccharide transport periplasmic protein LptA [Sulfurovum sp.]
MDFLKIVLFLMLTQTLFADKVEITSDSMKAEDLKKEIHFIGNAKIKKMDDWLHADRVIVYFDENNETKMYEALGLVTFEFKDEKSNYKGSADKVTYYPMKSNYILTGKAIIDDLANKRHVNGDVIILDMLTGNAEVQGSKKKPVKFTFDAEDSK